MNHTVAVVGLGYVGLPLAVAFGKQMRTIGFDLNTQKLASYKLGVDPSGEVSSEDLNSSNMLEYTNDPRSLADAEYVIVVVPTPIDQAQRPDLSPLEGACKTVAQNIRAGAIVIFESTVYPGCTEEVCVPILEKHSGLSWLGRCDRIDSEADAGFHIGYSPERINPGDKIHRLETITKVVSGDTPDTLDKVSSLYELIVDAGVHRAGSVKVAEAAKVIENTQRDLNIALMNELSLIFNKLEIDTLEVLEAAGTKWNFLPFRPGLVGGHCIGVDPYYLTYKAQSVGYHPQVVLAGRDTNDGMGKFIVEQTVKQLVKLGHPVSGAKVTVLGLTFKENCADLRNSRVIDIIHELESYGITPIVHDPLADAGDAKQFFNVGLSPWEAMTGLDAVIIAVGHEHYKNLKFEEFINILNADGCIIDVKAILNVYEVKKAGIKYWRL